MLNDGGVPGRRRDGLGPGGREASEHQGRQACGCEWRRRACTQTCSARGCSIRSCTLSRRQGLRYREPGWRPLREGIDRSAHREYVHANRTGYRPCSKAAPGAGRQYRRASNAKPEGEHGVGRFGSRDSVVATGGGVVAAEEWRRCSNGCAMACASGRSSRWIAAEPFRSGAIGEDGLAGSPPGARPVADELADLRTWLSLGHHESCWRPTRSGRIPCKSLLEPEGLRFGKFWSLRPVAGAGGDWLVSLIEGARAAGSEPGGRLHFNRGTAMMFISERRRGEYCDRRTCEHMRSHRRSESPLSRAASLCRELENAGNDGIARACGNRILKSLPRGLRAPNWPPGATFLKAATSPGHCASPDLAAIARPSQDSYHRIRKPT